MTSMYIPLEKSHFPFSAIKSTIALILILGFGTACQETPTREESSRPDTSRFTQKVVVEGLEEPIQIEFDNSGYVYWIERIGQIKRFNEKTGELELLGTLDLAKGNAPGLVGILLEKDFESSKQLYLFYSAAAFRFAKENYLGKSELISF